MRAVTVKFEAPSPTRKGSDDENPGTEYTYETVKEAVHEAAKDGLSAVLHQEHNKKRSRWTVETRAVEIEPREDSDEPVTVFVGEWRLLWNEGASRYQSRSWNITSKCKW